MSAGVIAVVPGHSSPAPGGRSISVGTLPAIRLTADQRVLYHLSSVAAQAAPQDPQGTSTVVSKTVYLSVTWVSAVPADPYGG
jgi:hypothetical protein